MAYINQKKYYTNDGVNPTDANWWSYQYVSLEDTIKGFSMVLNGELDDLPEQAFYLVGNIDEAISKAETLK